jgi:predicted transcriptional regulator
MTKKPQDVTEAEFTVLSHLWERGPSTTRQLAEALYPKKKGAAPTVLKLLERLEAKDCVQRDDSGPLLVFSAKVAREDLIEHRLNAVADDLCDGSRTPLLMHLVDPERLTSEEIHMLRQLVNELDEQTSRKKRR